MYRTPATREEDSGWRLFAGDEDNEYLNNPNNTQLMRVYPILDLDSSLLEPFQREVGTAFERGVRMGDGWRLRIGERVEEQVKRRAAL